MVYNFLCKDEKTRRNIYLLLLKTSGVERSPPFFRTVYPNRNHVTTHPVFMYYANFLGIVIVKKGTEEYLHLRQSFDSFVCHCI